MTKCKKCGTEFSVKTCPSCKKAANARWRDANREKIKSYNAKYRADNPEKVALISKTWRDSNSERISAYGASYREANNEKRRVVMASWRARNADKYRQYSANWRKENPIAVRTHSSNRRARKKGSGGALSVGIAEKLLKLQRGRCACCRKPLGKDYHLDHIIPLALGGTHTDENVQLLRSTCNQEKYKKHPIEFMQSRGFLL